MATCSYTRYARLGGGQEQKNAICILNLNMINDKVTAIYIGDMVMMPLVQVFAGLWFWHCVLLLFGLVRVITRLCQVSHFVNAWQKLTKLGKMFIVHICKLLIDISYIKGLTLTL